MIVTSVCFTVRVCCPAAGFYCGPVEERSFFQCITWSTAVTDACLAGASHCNCPGNSQGSSYLKVPASSTRGEGDIGARGLRIGFVDTCSCGGGATTHRVDDCVAFATAAVGRRGSAAPTKSRTSARYVAAGGCHFTRFIRACEAFRFQTKPNLTGYKNRVKKVSFSLSFLTLKLFL